MMAGRKFLVIILSSTIALSFESKTTDAAIMNKYGTLQKRNLEHCMKWMEHKQPLKRNGGFKNYLNLLSLCVAALPLTRRSASGASREATHEIQPTTSLQSFRRGNPDRRVYPGPGYSVCKSSPNRVCYHLLYNGKLRTIRESRSINNPRFFKSKKNPATFLYKSKNGELIQNFGRII